MAKISRPERLFSRYMRGSATNIVQIAKDFGEYDIRFVFLVDTDQGEHVAVKATNNSFTTPARIAGWKRLIDLYNDSGIYAPRIIPDLEGELCSVYCEGTIEFCVYAEEMKKNKTTKEFGLTGREAPFFDGMVAACAKMARASVALPAWSSAWCIYDTFCAEDETDETYERARHFCDVVDARMPQFRDRTRRIWGRFLSLYESLRPAYQQLPKAFLQGDEGGDNALVDENGNFVGVIDFNLAGAETILNYMFRNFCRVYIAQDEFPRLADAAFLRSKDAEMKARLDVVRRHYAFGDAERALFPAYYQMAYPLECDLCQSFEKAILRGDTVQAQRIFDWIDFQQTRDDIDLAIWGNVK